MGFLSDGEGRVSRFWKSSGSRCSGDMDSTFGRELDLWKPKVATLVTVSVPMEAPGEMVPPLLVSTLPLSVPLPLRVWPLTGVNVGVDSPETSTNAPDLMSIVALAREPEPMSANVPPLTVVEPV